MRKPLTKRDEGHIISERFAKGAKKGRNMKKDGQKKKKVLDKAKGKRYNNQAVRAEGQLREDRLERARKKFLTKRRRRDILKEFRSCGVYLVN